MAQLELTTDLERASRDRLVEHLRREAAELRCEVADEGGVGLIHFVAAWAQPICGPHRAEVAAAAQQLGVRVVECDVDSGDERVVQYKPLNVPATAVVGRPDSLQVGAHPAAELVARLRPFL
jgi:hypothetical protein